MRLNLHATVLGFVILCLGSAVTVRLPAAEALRLHPDNPHYFLWRGRPTILITSGEHYGAVLNRDFEFTKYLQTLAQDGLNLTRTMTGGSYVEPQGAFNIVSNTLAPVSGRYIAPWARSDRPGYAGGGNKFDLSRWDEAFFQRFRDFVAEAARRGIVVEVNLFCPMYEDAQWTLSPFNVENNINGMGNVARTNVFTLDRSGGLLEVQDRMVRRFVQELKDFDNVYYEICNEPYFGGVTLEWQRHIADVIVDAQKDHPQRKLISQNIANNQARIENPHPAVSIFNFHYASPPDTVGMNHHLNKVIGDNETGFRGTNDAPYRMEAWDFIIAGGALYNNLDYSFAVGHEAGTFVYPSSQPGGGNPGFRRQMRVLAEFINGYDFIRMKPDNRVIQGGVSATHTARALVEAGKAYAIYFRPILTTQFSVRWTGEIQPKESGDHTFHAASNDGARLWVNNRLIVDNWVEQGEKEASGGIQLEASKRYSIKLEYFYNGGQAAMKLRWSAPGRNPEVIPGDVLWNGDVPGLKGEYYQSHDFQRPRQTRIDPQVNFSWGTDSPFPITRGEGTTAPALSLPPGRYLAEWVDPLTGRVTQREEFSHAGGTRSVTAPSFTEDIALRILAR